MVKVSTSSGWTVFLAFLLFLSRLMGMENNFQNVVSITNGFITLTGMLIFSGTIEQLSGSLNASSKLFFQVSYLALLAGASAGLMEVPLALLFVGLGIRNILKLKLSGFFWLALATYIRLELGILLVVVGIYSILQKRSDFWKIAFFTTLGILPFLAYDLYFFHTIIPHSIVAKSVVYSIVPLQTFTRGLLLAFPLIVSNHQLFYFVALFILVLCILFSIVATLVLNPKSNMKTWIRDFQCMGFGHFRQLYCRAHAHL